MGPRGGVVTQRSAKPRDAECHRVAPRMNFRDSPGRMSRLLASNWRKRWTYLSGGSAFGFHQHHIAVTHRVNSVSPMLHHLGALPYKRQRSCPVVDRAGAGVIQIGELELNCVLVP